MTFDACSWIRATRFKTALHLNGASNRPQGGTGFRMLRAQFWTLAQANAFQKDAKVDPLRIEVVHPGGSVFWFFCFQF